MKGFDIEIFIPIRIKFTWHKNCSANNLSNKISVLTDVSTLTALHVGLNPRLKSIPLKSALSCKINIVARKGIIAPKLNYIWEWNRRAVDGVGAAGIRPCIWGLQDIELFVGVNRNHKLFKKGKIWMDAEFISVNTR